MRLHLMEGTQELVRELSPAGTQEQLYTFLLLPPLLDAGEIISF